MRALRVFGLALGLGTAAVAWAAPDESGDAAIGQLVKNARFWQQKGRGDRAQEAWRRVLLADPGNGEALLQVGTEHARQGRIDRARECLAKLRAAHPGDPGIG